MFRLFTPVRPSYFLASVGLVLVLAIASVDLGVRGSSTPRAAGAALGAPVCARGEQLNLLTLVSYAAPAAAAFGRQSGAIVHVYRLYAHYDPPPLRHPPIDLTWTDAELISQKEDAIEHIALHWVSPGLTNYTALGAAGVPRDHAYYPTGLAAAEAIVYDPRHVPYAGLPGAWSDLLNPAYHNRVALTSPFYTNVSYMTVTGIAQLLGGSAPGLRFLKRFKANGGRFFLTDAQTLASIEGGSRALGVVEDSSYYLAVHSGHRLGIIYPAAGVVALHPDLYVNAASKHRGCAEAFVNWVLSPAGQRVLAHRAGADADAYYVPVIRGAALGPPRRTTRIPFVGYKVVKWAPLALAFRESVNSSIQGVRTLMKCCISSCHDNCAPDLK